MGAVLRSDNIVEGAKIVLRAIESSSEILVESVNNKLRSVHGHKRCAAQMLRSDS